ncbi:MAG: transposase [Endomicrobium sp.]|jgi:hypothetical protein|uniref:hypothetical protein n=1 Tax=Candidatus Endomicrobiellum cubanum TaxID=3242325 RepID=UPI00283458FD|nr:transposase [Endomicrobium sp.]
MSLSTAIIVHGIGKVEDFEDSKNYVRMWDLPAVKNSADKGSNRHITQIGNKILRTRLVQVRLIAIRYSEYLRKINLKLKAKKSREKVKIAKAREMLEII